MTAVIRSSILLEVCVDDPAGLEAAIAGGADRIELCSALAVGGLTPSRGLMDVASTLDAPCTAMIRPRAGDFVYSVEELDVMLADVAAARAAGLAGVVLGASRPDGRLDHVVLGALAEAADGLDLTLHRCFDLVPDISEAVELAVGLGFSRILTSGGAKTALEGLAALRQTIDVSAGRISIMPGSGITNRNVHALLDLGVSEIHASCSVPTEPSAGKIAEFGFAAATSMRTDRARVSALKAALS